MAEADAGGPTTKEVYGKPVFDVKALPGITAPLVSQAGLGPMCPAAAATVPIQVPRPCQPRDARSTPLVQGFFDP